MSAATRHKLDTIGDIERVNSRGGYHFFDADTLRFFKSRIQPHVTAHRYFITSEKNDREPRRASIRCVMDNGSTETVGEFQQFASPAAAQKALDKALAAGIEVRNDPYEGDKDPTNPERFGWRAYVGELPLGSRTTKSEAEDEAAQAGRPGYC